MLVTWNPTFLFLTKGDDGVGLDDADPWPHTPRPCMPERDRAILTWAHADWRERESERGERTTAAMERKGKEMKRAGDEEGRKRKEA